MPSRSEPPFVDSPSPTQKPASLGLLSRLSSIRSRSSTVIGATGTSQRASSADFAYAPIHGHSSMREPENARDRLMTILASARHKKSTPDHTSVPVRRAVSGPALIGPTNDHFDPISPQAYVQQLAKTSAASSSTAPSPEAITLKAKLLIGLAQTLQNSADVDPLSMWQSVQDYAHALEPIEIRLAALEVLRVCIQLFVSANNPAYTLGTSTYQKAEFYACICNYNVELKECTQSEIRALTDAMDALCRGGRDISGLDGIVERACDWAGERFKRRQAERDALRRDYFAVRQDQSDGLQALAGWTVTPLQDPSYASVFVAWPIRTEEDADSHASAMRLITNMHKFSWSHLTSESIKFATGYLTTEALATSNDYVVKIVLEHIDVMSRYGFVPPELIENVVLLLARVVSTAGRSSILIFDSDRDRQPCNARLKPLSPELSDAARRIMRNLLKSSANQALRYIRAGTAPPPPRGIVSLSDRRDIQVVIGCLWCIRDALNEFRSSRAYRSAAIDALDDNVNSTFLDSWPILIAMGLPYFHSNLCDALEWNSVHVTEQVVLLLLDRLHQTSIESIEPTPTATPAVSPSKVRSPKAETAALAMTRVPSNVFDASHVAYDEWDLILDIIERVLRQMHNFEDEMERVLPIDLSDATLTASPYSPTPNDHVETVENAPKYFEGLRELLLLVIRAYLCGTYHGPLDRLFALFVILEPNLTDSSGVMLLEAYNRENICLPSNSGWLADLLEICRTFLSPEFGEGFHLRQSRSSEVDPHATRLVRPQSKIRCLALVSDTFEAVRAFPVHRNGLLSLVILPILESFLTPHLDLNLAPMIIDLAQAVSREIMSHLRFADEAESGEDAAFSIEALGSIRDILVKLASDKGRLMRSNSVKSRSSSIPSRLLKKGRPLEPFVSQPTVSAERHMPENDFPANAVFHSIPDELSCLSALALIEMFSFSLVEGSPAACQQGKKIFRSMLEILSPAVDSQSTNPSSTPAANVLPQRRVRFTILQFLVRLRATPAHRICLDDLADIEEMASALGRGPNAESDGPAHAAKYFNEDREARSRNIVQDSERKGRSSRSSSRTRSASRPRETGPALWFSPEELPFEINPELTLGSLGMLSFDHNISWSEIQENDEDGDFDFPGYNAAVAARSPSAPVLCPVSEYLEVVVSILRTETDWDLIAYTLCHLPAQLACKHFVAGPRASRKIKLLRAVLCHCLSNNSLASRSQLPPGAGRIDLPMTAYQSLATLVAYKSLFSQAQQDEMVKTFVDGLAVKDIAKPCIHALSMCCFEFQLSIVKYLALILSNFFVVLSSTSLAVHVLELLVAIGHLPTLYTNFSDAEYDSVFTIALECIIVHAQVDSDRQDEVGYAFSQYAFHLAYYVIDLWYMSLSQIQRRRHVKTIARKLVQANKHRPQLDEPSEVCLDMVARYAHANVDPRPRSSALRNALLQINGQDKSLPKTNNENQRSWISGHAIISVKTLSVSRWAELTIRRPSGLIQLLMELENVDRPQLRTDSEVMAMLVQHREERLAEHDAPADLAQSLEERLKEFGKGSEVTVKGIKAQLGIQTTSSAAGQTIAGPSVDVGPSFFGLQLSSYPEFGNNGPPVLIPGDDEKYQRAIRNIDNVPVVDFHKVAVLYVGPEDFNETDILANTHGSRDYVRFLASLGRLIRLQGNDTYYLGGLNRNNDSDGKWAYVWDNNVTQIIYHVATLMPNKALDPLYNDKKQHIGNDLVKIIFNDSGRPFAPQTVQSQFNFINIVIEPQTPVGKSWSAHGMASNATFFKVSMQRRPDMPEIGPIGVFKMISEASLADVVRQLALHCSFFAQIFLECIGVEGPKEGRPRTEYVSNWRRRLQMIKELKKRLAAEQSTTESKGGPTISSQVQDMLKAYDISHWT